MIQTQTANLSRKLCEARSKTLAHAEAPHVTPCSACASRNKCHLARANHSQRIPLLVGAGLMAMSLWLGMEGSK